MKAILPSIAAAFALVLSAPAADVTAKLTDVHLCCKGCVNGVDKAVGEVDGAKAAVDQDAGTVLLTAPDAVTLQKAAEALLKAGYFGKTSDHSVTLDSSTGAKDEK